MRFRASISTPASSRPRPSVFPTRPDANSTLSGLISSPLASVQVSPWSSRPTAALPAPTTAPPCPDHQPHPHSRKAPREELGDLRVEEGEYPLSSVDECHVDAERG